MACHVICGDNHREGGPLGQAGWSWSSEWPGGQSVPSGAWLPSANCYLGSSGKKPLPAVVRENAEAHTPFRRKGDLFLGS